jgi:hypothetical protein
MSVSAAAEAVGLGLARRANHFALSEPCQALARKIFCFRFSELCDWMPPVPPPPGGAYRDRHGRGKRDAVDAADMQRAVRVDEHIRSVRRNRVVPIPRRWDQASRDEREATAANKPGTPRRSRISRKTIAQGVPDCCGCPVVACVRKVHFSLHARLAGAASIRHSLLPLIWRDRHFAKLGRHASRGQLRMISNVIASEQAGSRAPDAAQRVSGALQIWAHACVGPGSASSAKGAAPRPAHES